MRIYAPPPKFGYMKQGAFCCCPVAKTVTRDNGHGPRTWLVCTVCGMTSEVDPEAEEKERKARAEYDEWLKGYDGPHDTPAS